MADKMKSLRDCFKSMASHYRDQAELHDKCESRHEQADRSDEAEFHKASAEHCRKMAGTCEKAANEVGSVTVEENGSAKVAGADDGKAVTAAVDALRGEFSARMEKFEKTLIPSGVRGVLPDIPGVQLIGRAGGPSAPVTDVPADFAHLFTE